MSEAHLPAVVESTSVVDRPVEADAHATSLVLDRMRAIAGTSDWRGLPATTETLGALMQADRLDLDRAIQQTNSPTRRDQLVAEADRLAAAAKGVVSLVTGGHLKQLGQVYDTIEFVRDGRANRQPGTLADERSQIDMRAVKNVYEAHDEQLAAVYIVNLQEVADQCDIGLETADSLFTLTNLDPAQEDDIELMVRILDNLETNEHETKVEALRRQLTTKTLSDIAKL